MPGVTPAKWPVTQDVTPGATPGAMADGNPGCNPGRNPGFGFRPISISSCEIRKPEIFSKLVLPTAQPSWEFAVSLFGNLESEHRRILPDGRSTLRRRGSSVCGVGIVDCD